MDAAIMTSHNRSAAHTVEGIARVVRVEGKIAWLEPEQTTSCGSCASKDACGHGDSGIGTVARRIEARRFQLDGEGLQEGDRIVLGVGQRALVKAAALAYGLPLFSAIAAGGFAQGAWGNDAMTMLAMAGGLGLGLLAAHLGARRLSARGELAPRYLRRALPGETCDTAKD